VSGGPVLRRTLAAQLGWLFTVSSSTPFVVRKWMGNRTWTLSTVLTKQLWLASYTCPRACAGERVSPGARRANQAGV